MKKIELLAPSGDIDSLRSAVFNGANAVYFGGKNFGARKFASNFSYEEIEEAIKFCHLYGVKAYITVNTIIYENEIEEVIDYVRFLHKVNVDALIVQDIGLMNIIKNRFPNLEVHASTQAHNYDRYSALFLKDLGCKRMVLSREMSLDEIKKIDVDIEKEVFIHGALCYSYSGCCLFSALNNSRSANRGECVGSCRMKYKLFKNNKEIPFKGDYLLSCKSLCTIDKIDKLVDSGINSFKIEGRMKSKEYVGYVSRLYRNKIDEYIKNNKFNVNSAEINNLKKLYNRELTEGFLFDKSDITNIKSSNHIGVIIGDVIDINSKYIKIKLSDSINQEDGIRFDNNEGMIVNRLYNNKLLLINSANKGDIIYLDNKLNIKNAKVIRKTIDKKLNEDISNYEKKKINISIECDAYVGNKLKIIISDNENTITKYGNIVEKSINSPTGRDRIIEQLSKLGNTPFETDSVVVNSDENIFLPIKELNELRRDSILELINIRENKRNEEFKELSFSTIKEKSNKEKLSINVFVRDEKQLREVLKYDIDKIYTDNYKIYLDNKDNCNIYYNVSRVDNNNYSNERLLVGSTSSIEKYKNKNIIVGDSYLNIVNSYGISYLDSYNVSLITLSYESTIDNVINISNNHSLDNVEYIIYGTPELMIAKHNLLGDDYDESSKYELESLNKDRFKVTYKDKLTHIYNSKVINRLEELNELKEIGIKNIRIEFFDEDSKTVGRILKEVYNG